jgi:HK97 family phage major capsid protein
MTLKEMLAAARAAVESGDLDKARTLTEQAKAMKALDELEPAPIAPAPVVRLPFGPVDAKADAPTEDPAMKAWTVKRFGEVPIAAAQIAKELYGQDYHSLLWAKSADFRRYLRTGVGDGRLAKLIIMTPSEIMEAVENSVSVAEMKTTSIEGQDSLGGYLVPEDFRAQILSRLPMLTVVRALASKQTTSRDRLTIPTATGGGSQYSTAMRETWVDENPTSTAAATSATWGQQDVPVHTAMAHIDISRNLLEDTAADLVGFLTAKFAEACAVNEDISFLIGTGVNQPQGILNGTAALGAPFNADVTTVNSGAASTLTADGLKAVPFGLTAIYRQLGGTWIMNKATALAISLMKDGTSRYLWSENNNNLANTQSLGQPLLGYSVKESEAMPDIGANKYPIIFGNFDGYTIVDRIGMSVVRYEDSTTAKTNTVVYYSRRRLGGQVTEGYRFIVQKCST